jgi:amino acid adenylation domain-containing protein
MENDIFDHRTEKSQESISISDDECSFASLLDASFIRHQHLPALRTASRTVSYRELDIRSLQIAHWLVAGGVREGETVGILLERGIEFVATACAVIRIGCTYLPLDPSYPAERLAFMASDASAALIVSCCDHRDLHGPMRCVVRELESSACEATQFICSSERRRSNADISVYVIYTSGTTGQPKGVPIHQQGLVNFIVAQMQALDVTRDCRFIQNSSICFDMSVWEIFLALCSGASLAIVERATLVDGRAFVAALRSFEVTHLLVTPSMLSVMPQSELPALTCIVSAGEKCSQALIDAWAPERKFYDAYGATEATVYTTVARCFAGHTERHVGRAMANTSVHVLDSLLRPVPQGEIGEIHIGGWGVAHGYLNRPELNATRFISHNGMRLYRTGDLGMLTADFNLVFKGRADKQIKINGFRIELEEIEASANRLPLVEGSHAQVVEQSGAKRSLVLYVVLSDKSVGVAPVRRHLRECLPRYMVPSLVIELERFPLTGSGKIDAQRLPSPFNRSDSMVVPEVQPEQVVEFEISDIWSSLLGHYEFTLTDSFFDVGGHSLLANQLFDSIEKRLGVHLPVSEIFTHDTVTTLSRRIRENRTSFRFSPLVRLRAGGERPLYCIHPGGGTLFCYHDLVRKLDPSWQIYGLQSRNANFATPVTCRSVQAMADDYASLILNNGHGTTINLIGWSFGGLIAYEIGRRLEASGIKIEFLGMIDSYLSGSYAEGIDINDAVGFTYRVFHGRLRAPVPTLLRAEVAGLPETEADSYLYRAAQREGIMPATVSFERALRSVDIHRESQLATVEHRVSANGPRATLFRATGNGDFAENARAGWPASTDDQIELIAIPAADHYSIIEAAALQSIIAALH